MQMRLQIGLEELIHRILNNHETLFAEAEMLLKKLNFEEKITGSHLAKLAKAKHQSLSKTLDTLVDIGLESLQEEVG